LSELVSEAKFPGNRQKYRDFYRRDLRVRLLARNPEPKSVVYDPIPYASEQGSYFWPSRELNRIIRELIRLISEPRDSSAALGSRRSCRRRNADVSPSDTWKPQALRRNRITWGARRCGAALAGSDQSVSGAAGTSAIRARANRSSMALASAWSSGAQRSRSRASRVRRAVTIRWNVSRPR